MGEFALVEHVVGRLHARQMPNIQASENVKQSECVQPAHPIPAAYYDRRPGPESHRASSSWLVTSGEVGFEATQRRMGMLTGNFNSRSIYMYIKHVVADLQCTALIVP